MSSDEPVQEALFDLPLEPPPTDSALDPDPDPDPLV